MKDGEVLDDRRDLYPLGRHAPVEIPVDLTGPNILLASYKQLSAGGTCWFLVPYMRKLHTRPAFTWTAVATIKVSLASLRQPL